jgi:hypothetical protein
MSGDILFEYLYTGLKNAGIAGRPPQGVLGLSKLGLEEKRPAAQMQARCLVAPGLLSGWYLHFIPLTLADLHDA